MEILFLLFVVAMFIGPLLYIGTLIGLIVTLVRVVKEIRERRLEAGPARRENPSGSAAG